FYRDATPSHSWLRYVYKYPQAAYPYELLAQENARRDRLDPPFNLLDTGVFAQSRYWDVEVFYAKASPTEIHCHIHVHNRGPEEADIHLLPTLWFRNTWTWGGERPLLDSMNAPAGAAWAVSARHPTLGDYALYGAYPCELLFTENESNAERLWGTTNPQPYVKDAFHRRLIDNELAAVNPARSGTKFAAWSQHRIAPGHAVRVDLVLSALALQKPFARQATLFSSRQSEANVFFDELLPDAPPEDHQIMRQAFAGMIWCKQFYHYDVERWLDGDQVPPPEARQHGRNATWRHLKAADIISMPDTWEYPWFAAWDLAFHAVSLALIDVDFAKCQMELMLSERYLHPNGQIPAYEWAFSDANPPVHALGCLKAFRAERVQRGQGDHGFLTRVFHKLLLNYAWWINRKDADGHNLFEGGFLGLDNISVYDRSQPLPPGYQLKQADATGWMAMFALNMMVMALELSVDDPSFEDIAIQCYQQFFAIANAIRGHDTGMVSLWDADAGFFKDLLMTPDGNTHRIDVYSWVGLIPLFAAEVVDQRLLRAAPRFARMLDEHKGGLFQGSAVCACPDWENERGEHLIALVDHSMLPRILTRLLDEEQFLSPYGVRSVSKLHQSQRDLGVIPGIGQAMIEYVPGESNSWMFGGNSNWRGPVWMPTNFALVQALEKFHRFLGDGFRFAVPCLGGQELTLKEIATLLAERLVDLYRRGPDGEVPALRRDPPFRDDPHWRDLCLFYEYFHGDTGLGLGAAHQTGWTGLIANLVMRRHRREIPEYWRLKADGNRAAKHPNEAAGKTPRKLSTNKFPILAELGNFLAIGF
ncbi:MAG: hypothetical protein N838_22980, partial [Thiohalocapsa sp. PB-PSB1]